METKGTIILKRPDGGPEVVSGDPDATIMELPNGWVINVSKPAPGRWPLSLSGNSGEGYTLTVMGNTPLRFERFEFVELKGMSFHESLFPLEGQPVFGRQTTALANLSGPFAETAFLLGTENGYVIVEVELVQGHSYASEENFVGEIDLPDEPFRVYASGKDGSGFDFLRAYSPIFQARTVEVKPLLYESDVKMVAGQFCNARFQVINHGNSEGSFDVSATDDQGFVQSVSSNQVTLAAGESTKIDVVLDIPEETPAETNVVLSLVATSTTDTSDENAAVLGWYSKAAETKGGSSSDGGGGGG
jgi:hypothetical protein